MYLFDNTVFEKFNTISKSPRGEYEISSLLNLYITDGTLKMQMLERGTAWLDAGQPDTLFQSAAYVKTIQERQGIRIGCIEEECYKKKFINKQQLTNIVEKIPKSEYKQYLEKLL
jgi:glucose-1-phosphate thymidylyltransferase